MYEHSPKRREVTSADRKRIHEIRLLVRKLSNDVDDKVAEITSLLAQTDVLRDKAKSLNNRNRESIAWMKALIAEKERIEREGV